MRTPTLIVLSLVGLLGACAMPEPMPATCETGACTGPPDGGVLKDVALNQEKGLPPAHDGPQDGAVTHDAGRGDGAMLDGVKPDGFEHDGLTHDGLTHDGLMTHDGLKHDGETRLDGQTDPDGMP